MTDEKLKKINSLKQKIDKLDLILKNKEFIDILSFYAKREKDNLIEQIYVPSITIEEIKEYFPQILKFLEMKLFDLKKEYERF